MNPLRSLALAGSLLCVSGCSFSMFTSTHDHREMTPAIERRIEALEKRMTAFEQAPPAIGPAENSSSGVAVPAGAVQPTGFEESPPAGGQPDKKNSPLNRDKRVSD